MAGQEQWRVFYAIDLPEPVRQRLAEHTRRLREAVPEAQASWTRPENVHLTLKFLGEIPTSRAERLSLAASLATEGLEPFKISIEQAGVFPEHGPPRVLWIGLRDQQGKLGRLQARLDDECAEAGFPKEKRPFHPHLTLARLRKPQHARTLASVHKDMEFGPVEMIVSELLVIRSELSSAGSKYSTISRHPLSVE
jgi:RNA 2',3'-cyclic 3'-phosphodiesterase